MTIGETIMKLNKQTIAAIAVTTAISTTAYADDFNTVIDHEATKPQIVVKAKQNPVTIQDHVNVAREKIEAKGVATAQESRWNSDRVL